MKKVFVLISLLIIVFLSGCIFDRTTSPTTDSTTTSTTVFPTTTTSTTTSTTDTSSTTATISGVPTLTSDSSIDYTAGTDVVLTFNLYEGSFVMLSGNGIEATDYELSGSQVTIDSDYIDSVFTANPGQDVIVLSYTFSYSGGAVVGYVYIHISE